MTLIGRPAGLTVYKLIDENYPKYIKLVQICTKEVLTFTLRFSFQEGKCYRSG